MQTLIDVLILIILIMITVFIFMVIYRKDIFVKVYKGFTRVDHRSFTREIDIKVTEDDLRMASMEMLAGEEEDESNFCKEMDMCKKYCNGEVCNAFRDQKITYDYCLDCEDKDMCWSDIDNSCVNCSDVKDGDKGCNYRYGCYKSGKSLKNPARNFCKICWKR